jgi:hypothetical protein
LTWQIEQKVRAKNTGLDRNLSLSDFIPVDMACPVPGHLIITTPILLPPLLDFLCRRQFAIGWSAPFSRGRLFQPIAADRKDLMMI